MPDDPVPPEILAAFAQESGEAFEAMEQSIMLWEKGDRPLEQLQNVFRLAHSVKGAANSVGLRILGTLSGFDVEANLLGGGATRADLAAIRSRLVG